MNSYKTAANLLACFILIAAILRAFAFWAADPMLAYANNYDQIRTLKVFGLHPKDSPKALYEMTPEQPYRYFVQADTLHPPIYPSSDLLFKAIQVGTMTTFRSSDGVMDIKIATAPVLLSWLLGLGFIFKRLASRPLAALGFAGWILLVADPINLLFLNTWYAEFSAFAIATLFVGIAWLWLFQLLSLRRTLVWGGACLAILSFNRNQYMFLLPAVAALVGCALILSSRSFHRPSRASAAKWVVIAIACLLPMLVYNAAGKKKIYIETATNRVNTVFGALLPASKNPIETLENLGLSPEGCLQYLGQSLYSRPEKEFKLNCPKALRLSLIRIAKAIVHEPAISIAVIRHVAQQHRGFLQYHIGHIEGMNNAYISPGVLPHFNGREFITPSDKENANNSDLPYYIKSINPMIKNLSANTAEIFIWFFIIGPMIFALIAWVLKKHRWVFIFFLNTLLFSYALTSSVLGDGYFELERHAFLCFSFGGGFLFFLAVFVVSTLNMKIPLLR